MNKCHECGWEDSDIGFFTEEAGRLYCSLHRSLSMQELSELTHETQVERFNWCSCEELEQGDLPPYKDCINPKFISYEMVCPDCDCAMTQITRGEPHAICSCGGSYTLITEKERV